MKTVQNYCNGADESAAEGFECVQFNEFFVSAGGEIMKRKGLKNKLVANFFISIVGIVDLHERDDILKLFDLRICYVGVDGRAYRQPLIVRFDEVCDLANIITKSLPGCFVASAKDFAQFVSYILRACEGTLITRNTYRYSGWENVNGQMIYLSNSCQFCKTDMTVPRGYANDREAFNYVFSILNVGKGASFKEDGRNPMFALLAYLLAGYAAKPLEDAGIPLRFPLCIVGDSGSFKTSVCLSLFSPFGSPAFLQLESTEASLTRYLCERVDSIFFIDDAYRQSNEMMRKAELIIRAFGDGQARARANNRALFGILQAPVRGGCLLTSENHLNLQRSSALRVLNLSVSKGSFDSEALSVVQSDAAMGANSWLARFFGGWIEWVETNYGKFISEIDAVYDKILPELSDGRVKQAQKVLLHVATEFIQWGRSIGALEEEDVNTLAFGFYDEINVMLLENQAMAKVDEPWLLFARMLSQSLADGSLQIAANKEIYEDEAAAYFGFFDRKKNLIVLSPERTFSLINKRFRDLGVRHVIPLDIWRSLCEHGVCEGYQNHSDGNGRTRNRAFKKIKINGNIAEMAVLRLSALEIFEHE